MTQIGGHSGATNGAKRPWVPLVGPAPRATAWQWSRVFAAAAVAVSFLALERAERLHPVVASVCLAVVAAHTAIIVRGGRPLIGRILVRFDGWTRRGNAQRTVGLAVVAAATFRLVQAASAHSNGHDRWMGGAIAVITALLTGLSPRESNSDAAIVAASLAAILISSLQSGVPIVLLSLWASAAVAALASREQARWTGMARLGGGASATSSRWLVTRTVLLVVAVVLMASTLYQRVPKLGLLGLAPRSVSADTDGPSYGLEDRLDTAKRGKPSNAVVLRIAAAAPDLWRGQTFDAWDGRSWTSSQPMRYFRARPPVVRPPLGDGDVATTDSAAGEAFAQRIEVVRGDLRVVLGANRIESFSFPDRYERFAPDRPSGFRLASSGGAVGAIPLFPGDSMVVVSRRPVVTAEGLRAHDPIAQGVPDALRERYLDMSASTPARVLALAEQVAGSAHTAYDKVIALETWMHENVRYTLDIDPLPDGADTVDQFLFVDRKGFCEQIATSLAVMLRSQGVPTRLATGFAPGRYNAALGAFEERASDAHAWVEVWFPDIGWQGFDPTAEVPLSGEAWSPPPPRQLPRWLLTVARSALVGGTLLGLTVLVQLLRSARRRRLARPWAPVLWHRIQQSGRERGRGRRPHETIGEYAAALRLGPLPDDRLLKVARHLEASLYGPNAVGESRIRWADACHDTTGSAAAQSIQLYEAVIEAHPPVRWWRNPRL